MEESTRPKHCLCRIWGVRVSISTQFTALKGISGPEGFLRFHPVSTGPGHESLEHISHSEQNHVYLPQA